MQGKCQNRNELKAAKEAVFQFLKRNGHKPFQQSQLVPYMTRVIGDVQHQVKTDIKWYIDNLWVEVIAHGVYRVRLDRDMSRLKYRNQCSKKFLTR
ncbi:hypothetical protein PMW_22 [Pseudomonas phage phiPMW]|uniref:Uncharacterized protein n=1 Tax=Pseudomonas phage phiPMW TaxID=1815582 RepID=A0A1S5R192_9CAUD|nr:hypothetical protein FDG97_gp022 [Pseudomonas phage phiPMW]ANA49147.1 hypothetical protein PMW_22 [Pseudomonas phage phiPMW]